MTASESEGGGRATGGVWRGGDWYGNCAVMSAYGLLALQVLCFAALAIADPEGYRRLAQEGRVVENLTAVWQLGAGVVLLVVAWLERDRLPRVIYIVGGVLMLFFAGEELSWGQQIWGFATPDALADINYQNEFNVHNIDLAIVELGAVVYDNLRLPLCIVAVAALVYGKGRRLLGIPLPSMPLLASVIVADAVLYYTYVDGPRVWAGFVFYQSNILLLILMCYAVISKQVRLLVLLVTAAAVIGANGYAMSLGLWEATGGKIHEIQEYLFSCVYLWYGVELLTAQGKVGAWWGEMPLRIGRQLRELGYYPRFGTAICGLAIAGSMGLAVFTYWESVRQSEQLAAVYGALIADNAPLTGAESESPFDIYGSGGQLYYIKEECAAGDIADNFFLHIYPEQVGDLPSERRQYGFENRDFAFGEHRARLNEVCMASVPLPGYPIAWIRTGQYRAEGPRVWEAELALPPVSSAP